MSGRFGKSATRKGRRRKAACGHTCTATLTCKSIEIYIGIINRIEQLFDIYSTVLEKVNFAHRARNAFEREPNEREGPNFSKASSIECNERDHSKSSRASSSARLSREICNFQFVVSSIRKFMEVSKCNVSAMFVFPIHLYQFIH